MAASTCLQLSPRRVFGCARFAAHLKLAIFLQGHGRANDAEHRLARGARWAKAPWAPPSVEGGGGDDFRVIPDWSV